MRFYLALLLLPLAVAPAHVASGQTTVSGRVSAGGAPVPFASVAVRGTTIGSPAGEDGTFRIESLRPGTYTISASSVGFTTVDHEIVLRNGDRVTLNFELEEAAIQQEGVVVTGTMLETFVADSPVKVEVITPRYLSKIPTVNIMDVIGNVNGLYQQIDCGVCYTNNIRINGMEGPYTAVLIDGMPIMSALATVYGLNGINPSLIHQIEVVKGPVSTLYGTEAMAGVINIITKRPELAPRISLNTFGTSDGEVSLDFSAVPARQGRLAAIVSGSTQYMGRFLDGNGDSFSDVPLTKRLSFFSRTSLDASEGEELLDLSAKYYYEDRFGGVRGWSKSERGSDEIYGESVYTNRLELIGSFQPAIWDRAFRVDFAANHHHQDSYYGKTQYLAEQQVFTGNVVWSRSRGAGRSMLLGAALRYQRYDDNTPATATTDRRFIPGLFAQYEAAPTSRLRLLAGARVDHHAAHGFIFSPRLSTKIDAGPNTTVRINTGTGFRSVNLFTEDHAALTGSRQVVIRERLDPERSYSITTSIQQIFPFGSNPLTVDLDAFFTRFMNQILPDYSVDPNLIVYENLDGTAVSRGVSLTVSQNFTLLPLSYTVGATIMDVSHVQDNAREAIEFSPEYQAVVNASYHARRFGLSLDYTANVTGPMRLPEYEPPFQRPTRSPAFSTHNVQITKELPVGGNTFQLYIAAENLFDYTQESPLIDPGNPFGEHFDTAYVYAPIHGRCLGAGLRWNMR